MPTSSFQPLVVVSIFPLKNISIKNFIDKQGYSYESIIETRIVLGVVFCHGVDDWV
jgi:hypothetical protein